MKTWRIPRKTYAKKRRKREMLETQFAFPLQKEACGATIFFSVCPKNVRDFPERRKLFFEEKKKSAY